MEDSLFLSRFNEALRATPDEECLVSRSSISSISNSREFRCGTGLSITQYMAARLLDAQEEIAFVTCFWARSRSLDTLNEALRELDLRASNAVQPKRLRVRICFSSLSLAQKLFHTSSTKGRVWPPDTWQNQLGLPNPNELTNLDLEVRSLFFRPVSVLHSKFVVVDRKLVMLPSSNISWECWLECCLTLQGPIVKSFVQLWNSVWETTRCSSREERVAIEAVDQNSLQRTTLLLPHPWHQNPAIPFFRWIFCLAPPLRYSSAFPPSPQNLCMLQAINSAKTTIYIQTPNFTCNILIAAIFDALQRGVNIELVSCKNMMVLEQLVTAFQTTEWCISKLLRRLKRESQRRSRLDQAERGERVGQLTVKLFKPSTLAHTFDEEADPEYAQQSHVKALVVDDWLCVLGSGNCDRASWYTSLEVNVAIFDREFSRQVRAKLSEALGGNTMELFVG